LQVKSDRQDPLQYKCSAEDVGCQLRAECDGQSARSSSLVTPYKPALQLLHEKLEMKQHSFKVRQASDVENLRPLVVEMLPDKIKLRDAKPKTWHKESYSAGVFVVFKPGSETDFDLTLGTPRSRRKPITLSLATATRQQRDMLLLALCAFSRHGWLDAALAGSPQPVPLPGSVDGFGPEPSLLAENSLASMSVSSQPTRAGRSSFGSSSARG